MTECPRCGKQDPAEIHTCTPTPLWRLIEDLELNHEYCPKDVILQAAAELRRLHAEVEEQCRLNAMGQEREARLMAEVEQLKRQLKANEVGASYHLEVIDELVKVLREAEYALDYASDITKPDGLSGCDCPICTVSIKVRAAIREGSST